MIAFLGVLFLAVLANAQRPEPCSEFLIPRYVFLRWLGIRVFTGDFKWSLPYFEVKNGLFMGTKYTLLFQMLVFIMNFSGNLGYYDFIVTGTDSFSILHG